LNPDLKWVMFVNLGMKLAMVKTSIFWTQIWHVCDINILSP
jgi:hypothetical protein